MGSLAARPVRVDGHGGGVLPGCALRPKGSYVESRSRADIASPWYIFEKCKHATFSFSTHFHIFPHRVGYIFHDCFYALICFEKCKHVTVSFITGFIFFSRIGRDVKNKFCRLFIPLFRAMPLLRASKSKTFTNLWKFRFKLLRARKAGSRRGGESFYF